MPAKELGTLCPVSVEAVAKPCARPSRMAGKLMAPVMPPLPTPRNRPFQSCGSHSSISISVSSTAAKRQKAVFDTDVLGPASALKAEGGKGKLWSALTASAAVMRTFGSFRSFSWAQAPAPGAAEADARTTPRLDGEGAIESASAAAATLPSRATAPTTLFDMTYVSPDLLLSAAFRTTLAKPGARS